MIKKLMSQALQQFFKALPRYQEHSAILMLHRVGARDSRRISANQNMIVTPEELDAFIESCKKSGWTFISLDELLASIKKRASVKKTLILTFDDGYLDNLLEAAPVLVSGDVPFTVYVSTGFIESEVVPWWYELEMILNSCRELRSPDGFMVSAKNLAEKEAAFLSIRKRIIASGNEVEEFKDWFDLNLNGETRLIETNRLFMNWEEVVRLANLPNATIGAHTHTHPVLSQLSNDDAFEEIQRSKDILENRLARPVYHFAYPFGGASEACEREFFQVAALGFKTAVTTRIGALDSMLLNQYALPRFFFGPGVTLDYLQSQLFENELKSRVKRLLSRG